MGRGRMRNLIEAVQGARPWTASVIQDGLMIVRTADAIVKEAFDTNEVERQAQGRIAHSGIRRHT
jgi:hypothetical protein